MVRMRIDELPGGASAPWHKASASILTAAATPNQQPTRGRNRR
jgi:hypothetical protein